MIKTGVINRKGGVCKSTTAVNLAAIAGQRGLRTLLVDLDPQGTCTANVGIDDKLMDDGKNIDDYAASRIFIEKLAPSLITLDTGFGFDIIPAGHELMALEQFIPSVPNGDTLLTRVINADKNLNYDFILFDSPGFTGHIMASIINATGDIVIPNVATPSNTRALLEMVPMIAEMNEFRASFASLGPIKQRGHFFCRAKPQELVYRDQERQVEELLGDVHLSNFYISASTEIGKSEVAKVPFVLMEEGHRITTEYNRLFDRLFKDDWK